MTDPGRRVGFAEPSQVRRNDAITGGYQLRRHLVPQGCRIGESVQQQDRRTGSRDLHVEREPVGRNTVGFDRHEIWQPGAGERKEPSIPRRAARGSPLPPCRPSGIIDVPSTGSAHGRW